MSPGQNENFVRFRNVGLVQQKKPNRELCSREESGAFSEVSQISKFLINYKCGLNIVYARKSVPSKRITFMYKILTSER